MKRERAGFTIVELMVVVVIIGILAAVAVTRYQNTMRKAHEGATRGNLGTLRSALKVYYSDMEGNYPSSLAVLATNGKYISRIPEADMGAYHAVSGVIHEGGGVTLPDDTGGWHYNGVAASPNMGTLWVNCTHTDVLGQVWTAY